MGISLGALLSGGANAVAQYDRGQIQGEEARRKREQENAALQRQIAAQALQSQLVQLQIDKAKQGPQAPWQAAGFADAQSYLDFLTKETAAKTAPPKPVQTPWAAAGFADPKSYLDYLRKKSLAEDTTPHNPPASQLTQDETGAYVLVDPRTGQTRPVQRNGQAVMGPPKAGAVPKPTEGERRASGLLTGADEAWREIQGLLNDPNHPYNPLSESALSRGVGTISRNAQRAMLSSEGKRFFNAAERLITNYLYTASGATANPGEIASQARQMTADMFDDPASMQQKLRFMQGKLDEMRMMAGSAVPQAPAPTTMVAPGSGGARPSLDELFQ